MPVNYFSHTKCGKISTEKFFRIKGQEESTKCYQFLSFLSENALYTCEKIVINIGINRSFATKEQNLGNRSATRFPVNACYVPRTERSGVRVQRGSERSGESRARGRSLTKTHPN